MLCTGAFYAQIIDLRSSKIIPFDMEYRRDDRKDILADEKGILVFQEVPKTEIIPSTLIQIVQDLLNQIPLTKKPI